MTNRLQYQGKDMSPICANTSSPLMVPLPLDHMSESVDVPLPLDHMSESVDVPLEQTAYTLLAPQLHGRNEVDYEFNI